jgi:hypothetical protein
MKVLFNADGSITVTLADGTPVGTATAPGTVIPPGLYNIHIDDTAAVIHVFDLSGPGVYVNTNPLTAGPDGEAVFNEFFEVTFQPGSTYIYQDDNAPVSTRRVFSTTAGGGGSNSGSAGASVSSSGKVITGSPVSGTKSTGANVRPAAPVAFRGSLTAAVEADGSPRLTFKGRPVGTLRAGRYSISVFDRSRDSGLIVQKSRRAATTLAGTSFVGKRTATIVLTPGQWFFYPTFVGKKTYFIVTA